MVAGATEQVGKQFHIEENVKDGLESAMLSCGDPKNHSKRKRTEGGSSEQGKHKSKRNVSFSPSVKVMLIPERVEYKSAQVDRELWWSRSDFQSFHQSAFSELKLFSICENINSKEARKLLYQPTIEESCMSQARQHDLDLHKTSPSAAERDLIFGIRSPVQSKASNALDSLCSAETDSAEQLHFMRHRSSVAMNLCDQGVVETSSKPVRYVDNELVHNSEPFDFLSLCVPAQQPQPLSTTERSHGGPGGRISNGRRRWSSRTSNSNDDAGLLQGANGLTFFLGLCSFTLPIFGYYIMHYCQ